jgi:transcriptional regulator with XRE-family HTH domain
VPDDAASQIVSELSKRLAQEREAAGVSKKALAAMAGFDRSTARYIEDPDENPTLLNLIRYGLAMKLDVGKLLSEYLVPHLTASKPRTGKAK